MRDVKVFSVIAICFFLLFISFSPTSAEVISLSFSTALSEADAVGCDPEETNECMYFKRVGIPGLSIENPPTITLYSRLTWSKAIDGIGTDAYRDLSDHVFIKNSEVWIWYAHEDTLEGEMSFYVLNGRLVINWGEPAATEEKKSKFFVIPVPIEKK